MSQIITAFVYFTSEQTISGELTKDYQKIGNQLLFGLPMFCYYLGVIAVVVVVRARAHAGRAPHVRHRRQHRGRPPRRRRHRPPGVAVARGVGRRRRLRRHRVLVEGRHLRAEHRPRLPVPRDRRRVLRRLADQGPPQRVGGDDRAAGAGHRHQGHPAHFSGSSRWIEPLFYGLSLLVAVSLASRSQVVKIPKRKTPQPVEPAPARSRRLADASPV